MHPGLLVCRWAAGLALAALAAAIHPGSATTVDPGEAAPPPTTSSPAPRARDAGDEARELLDKGKAAEAVELLEQHLRFAVGDAATHEVLAEALVKLRRLDEAAHHFELALDLSGDDDRQARSLAKGLARADSLNRRRESVFEKITGRLFDSARKLREAGHPERALDLAERLGPIAPRKYRDSLSELAAEIRAATEEVQLDKAGSNERPSSGWPLHEHESEHYKLVCNLEPEVTELVGQTMDDIYAYYVLIYYDGKWKSVPDRKATIRIFADHQTMLGAWSGGSAPSGWWSPGEWKVTTYDTRTDNGGGGDLEWMLEILFHEASHQFMTMIEKGGNTPAWLNEGTASFFEGATAMADRRVLWPDAAVKRLQNLNRMIPEAGKGEIPSLADVIGYNSPSSYPGSYYAWGWGLAYYLQQYEDPDTLEYVYRPLYSEYRQRIIQKGGDPRELFDDVMLGEDSPRGHATFADFERDWSSWIQDVVYTEQFGNERRKLRMDRALAYVKAARRAEGKKKAPVPAEELWLRALGQIEFVRTRIDGPDQPDPQVLLLQADILETVGREESSAPLLETVLSLIAAGDYEVKDEELAALEERLARIDRSNAPLRTARARAKGLATTARKLFEEYQKVDPPMLLRSYTFARLAGNALEDTEVLLPAAEVLRAQAREAGLLRGTVMPLRGSTWSTIFVNKETSMNLSGEKLMIEGVRPVGRLCLDVPIQGEYELRARMRRVGDVHRSSFHGIVFAGTAGGDWMVIGVNGRDDIMLKRLNLGSGGGVTDRAFSFVEADPRPVAGEPIELTVRVLPSGSIDVRLGDGPLQHFDLPLPVPSTAYAGVYVKDGRNEVSDLVVELLP